MGDDQADCRPSFQKPEQRAFACGSEEGRNILPGSQEDPQYMASVCSMNEPSCTPHARRPSQVESGGSRLRSRRLSCCGWGALMSCSLAGTSVETRHCLRSWSSYGSHCANGACFGAAMCCSRSPGTWFPGPGVPTLGCPSRYSMQN